MCWMFCWIGTRFWRCFSTSLQTSLVFFPSIILKTRLLSQELVEVSVWQIAARALKWALACSSGTTKLPVVVYTENSGLFGCWGADVRSHLPIKQDCEPFAEGATFRLHALRDGSLGFSFLQIPRSCSESPTMMLRPLVCASGLSLVLLFGVWDSRGFCTARTWMPCLGDFFIYSPIFIRSAVSRSSFSDRAEIGRWISICHKGHRLSNTHVVVFFRKQS